jgi:hypothetical protein
VKKDASFFQNLANPCLSLIWQHDCIAGACGVGAGRLGLWSGIVFNL